jgi:hypothetical protein
MGNRANPPPPGVAAGAQVLSLTVGVSGALLLAGAIVALLTRLVDARGARDVLAFGFVHMPMTLGEAWSILVSNTELACIPIVFALVLRFSPRVGFGRAGALTCRAGRLLMDTVLLAGVLVNVLVVGVAVGAYGVRMIMALLPHGPVEVLSFSAAVAVYVAVRRDLPLSHRTIGVTIGGCLAGLAIAAALETFVAL